LKKNQGKKIKNQKEKDWIEKHNIHKLELKV